MTNQEKILEEIARERRRQDEKWGIQSHPSFDCLMTHRRDNSVEECLARGYGIPTPSTARDNCEYAANTGRLSWLHIVVEEISETLEAKNDSELRIELIQAAAVLVAWAEDLDSKVNP